MSSKLCSFIHAKFDNKTRASWKKRKRSFRGSHDLRCKARLISYHALSSIYDCSMQGCSDAWAPPKPEMNTFLTAYVTHNILKKTLGIRVMFLSFIFHPFVIHGSSVIAAAVLTGRGQMLELYRRTLAYSCWPFFVWNHVPFSCNAGSEGDAVELLDKSLINLMCLWYCYEQLHSTLRNGRCTL